MTSSAPIRRAVLLVLPLSLLLGFARFEATQPAKAACAVETADAAYASTAMDLWLTADTAHTAPSSDLSLASDAMDCWLTLDTH